MGRNERKEKRGDKNRRNGRSSGESRGGGAETKSYAKRRGSRVVLGEGKERVR